MYVLYAVAVPIAHNTGRSLSEKKTHPAGGLGARTRSADGRADDFAAVGRCAFCVSNNGHSDRHEVLVGGAIYTINKC
jgi:hypothetical protein